MTAAQDTVAHDPGRLDGQVLADRARRGDERAFQALYRRLAPSAWRLALAVTRDPGRAAAATARAFGATFAGETAAPATVPVRSGLLAAVRVAATAPDLVPAAVGQLPPAPSTAVAEAFRSLPERWRSALWLLDAEHLQPHVAAPVLGVPVAGAAPLAARARAGLRDEVLAVHAQAAGPIDCCRVLERLADHLEGRLTARDERRVRRHLDGCDACCGVLDGLDGLIPALRSLALPLPAALAVVAEERWRLALVRPAGPLHLTLPGGRPVPAWAERAVAGAAAAVIALGISSAILVAGRGGRVRDDRLARSIPSAAPLGLGDGESALGGVTGLASLDDGRDTSLAGGNPLAVGRASGAPRATSGSGTGGAAPADSSTPVAAPAPSSPAAPSAPTSPPPAPPTTDEPVLDVTVGLDGVAGVTISDDCTGASVLGLTIGCAPTASGEALQLDTGGSLLSGLGR